MVCTNHLTVLGCCAPLRHSPDLPQPDIMAVEHNQPYAVTGAHDIISAEAGTAKSRSTSLPPWCAPVPGPPPPPLGSGSFARDRQQRHARGLQPLLLQPWQPPPPPCALQLGSGAGLPARRQRRQWRPRQRAGGHVACPSGQTASSMMAAALAARTTPWLASGLRPRKPRHSGRRRRQLPRCWPRSWRGSR